MAKLEYVKAYPELYAPGTEPSLVDVPGMLFLMADGSGDPNDLEGEFTKAVELLYAFAYTIKMSPKAGSAPEGYFEYAMPPLEGLWGFGDGASDVTTADKRRYCWTAMIRQPEFVTDEFFQWAAGEVRRKKKLDTTRARLVRFEEGLCVQCMHIGPYAEEPATIGRMHTLAGAQGFVCDLSGERRHHEIYMGDPRRAVPEKMKTVLRLPVRRAR